MSASISYWFAQKMQLFIGTKVLSCLRNLKLLVNNIVTVFLAVFRHLQFTHSCDSVHIYGCISATIGLHIPEIYLFIQITFPPACHLHPKYSLKQWLQFPHHIFPLSTFPPQSGNSTLGWKGQMWRRQYPFSIRC